MRRAFALDVELVPVPSRPSYYAAMLGGRLLVRSRQPLLDAARVLMAEGGAPETILAARHVGSAIVAMRSTVGEAAKWTVLETDRDGLRRVRFHPARHARGQSEYAPPGDDTELAGTESAGKRPRPFLGLCRGRSMAGLIMPSRMRRATAETLDDAFSVAGGALGAKRDGYRAWLATPPAARPRGEFPTHSAVTCASRAAVAPRRRC